MKIAIYKPCLPIHWKNFEKDPGQARAKTEQDRLFDRFALIFRQLNFRALEFQSFGFWITDFSIFATVIIF